MEKLDMQEGLLSSWLLFFKVLSWALAAWERALLRVELRLCP
jgi:hypothetical protein